MSEDTGFQFTDEAVPRAYDEVLVRGILLILFVIFMPRGIVGLLETTRPSRAGAATSACARESGGPEPPTAAAGLPIARD